MRRKSKLLLVHDENPMAYFRRFWVKELRQSETILHQKFYLYRSMRLWLNFGTYFVVLLRTTTHLTFWNGS